MDKIVEATQHLADDCAMPVFQYMPLNDTWVPQYIQLNTIIMRQQLFQEPLEGMDVQLRSVYRKQISWNDGFHVLENNNLIDENGKVGDWEMNTRDDPVGAFRNQTSIDERRLNNAGALQTRRVVVMFRGTIYTDSVGVSVIKVDQDTRANQGRNAFIANEEDDAIRYIEDNRAHDTVEYQKKQHRLL